MKITYDDNYGADADGNRGISVIDEVELDDEDYDAIKEAIFETWEDEEYNDEITINLWVFEELEPFDVLISDYFSFDEFNKMKKELLSDR